VLGIVLMLIIWFLASSASSRGDAQDIEATVITTLFAPETAAAEATAESELGNWCRGTRHTASDCLEKAVPSEIRM
jgi:hypothetical protein